MEVGHFRGCFHGKYISLWKDRSSVCISIQVFHRLFREFMSPLAPWLRIYSFVKRRNLRLGFRKQ